MTQSRPFLIIAHRGAPNHAPENTIAAFDSALELGFRHIELDAQLTADGVAVVLHDDALDRTTDGTGPLAAHALAEVRRLDAGSWFGSEFAGEQVPTLEEVLRRYRRRAYLHLELKSTQEALPRSVAELLVATGWPVRETPSPEGGWPSSGVTISSFHKPQLERMRALLPDVPLAWLVQSITGDVLAECVEAGFQLVCPRASTVTAETVAEAHRLGLQVRAWGLRTLDELRLLAECGVAGTTCDWPDRARSHLASRGIPTCP
jgi:glycerophosphoryl diester phosphodiesterase